MNLGRVYFFFFNCNLFSFFPVWKSIQKHPLFIYLQFLACHSSIKACMLIRYQRKRSGKNHRRRVYLQKTCELDDPPAQALGLGFHQTHLIDVHSQEPLRLNTIFTNHHAGDEVTVICIQKQSPAFFFFACLYGFGFFSFFEFGRINKQTNKQVRT